MDEEPRTAQRARTIRRKRIERREFGERAAAAAIGPIERGMEVFVLTAGQFSLIDVIVHCLAGTGPADVVISTWTAAGADLEFAGALLREDRIRSLRFLVDFSFPSRQPAYCAALVSRFGVEALRISKNHAKFVLIQNQRWHLVIRTSMNLNENRRFETVEVSDDPALGKFLERFVAEVFASESGAESVERAPGERMQAFDRFVGSVGTGRSTDVEKIMSDAAFGNDIRRAGLSYLRGRR